MLELLHYRIVIQIYALQILSISYDKIKYNIFEMLATLWNGFTILICQRKGFFSIDIGI